MLYEKTLRGTLPRLALATALTLSLGACGGGESSASAAPKPSAQGLSEFELTHGIGPVKAAVDLGAADPALAEKGKPMFEAKCGVCHKMDERYVGPALGEVLSRRSPAYVMNMILNPQEMVQKHPEAKKLLGEFLTVMPFQNVTQDEARTLVEYLRANQSPKG